jgi:hypothetical protein
VEEHNRETVLKAHNKNTHKAKSVTYDIAMCCAASVVASHSEHIAVLHAHSQRHSALVLVAECLLLFSYNMQ